MSETAALDRAKAHAARQQIVAARPDRNDPDVWPDIDGLPGRLLKVLDLLDAEVKSLLARGQDPTYVWAMRTTVEQSRDALIAVRELSALEEWRILHPERYDVLDGVSDCGGGDCPRTGFRNAAEGGDVHRRRWPKR